MLLHKDNKHQGKTGMTKEFNHLINILHKVTGICTTCKVICIAMLFMKGKEQGEFHRSADVDFQIWSAILRICK